MNGEPVPSAEAPPVIENASSGLPKPTAGRPEAFIGRSIALVAVYLVVLTVVQTLVTAVGLVKGKGFQMSPWTSAAMIALSFVATLPLLPVLVRRRWRDLLPPRLDPLAAIPGVLLLTLGGWLWALEIGIVTERVFPMPAFIAKFFEEFLSTDDPVGSLLLIMILPPIVEETLCRGVVLEAMLLRWRPWIAVSASAILFGFIHLNPWQFFYATWIGLVIGFVYLRFRSLGLCMLMHGVNNGMSWLMLRWRPEWAGMNSSPGGDPPAHLPVLILLAGSGLLVAGAALILKLPVRVPSAPTSDPDSLPTVPQ